MYITEWKWNGIAAADGQKWFNQMTLDILFRQITTFIKVRVAFVFRLQTHLLIDFTKIVPFKGLQPKNKGHTNFYECCDLMEKVYLTYIKYVYTYINAFSTYFIIYMFHYILNAHTTTY